LKEKEYGSLCEMRITGLSFLNCTKDDLFFKMTWGYAIEIYTLKEEVSSGNNN
jgi:hypothetical protein